jgi:hypothetical protein
MRIRQAALALVGLVGSSGVASAGLIPTPVVISTAQTPGVPSPGTLTMTFDPSGTLQLTPGVPLQIGAIQLGPAPRPVDDTIDSFTAVTTATVAVKVTDSASGWMGTLKMDIAAVDMWTLRTWDGLWIENQFLELGDAFGQNPASTSVDLKGWRYTLTATPDMFRDSATFTLTTTPIQTPEPSTLALSLVATILGGLRAVRRKSRRVDADSEREQAAAMQPIPACSGG